MPHAVPQLRRRPAWRGALLLALAAVLALAACRQAPADDDARRQQAFALYDDYRKQFPDVTDIAPADALALWREDKAVFVDARTEAERAVSTLPGALDESAFLADPGRFAGKTVIVSCTIGYRSGLLTRKLNRQGIAAVNLAGGILGWLHAGGPIVDAAGQPAKRVHVYGRTWDLAPLRYTAIW